MARSPMALEEVKRNLEKTLAEDADLGKATTAPALDETLNAAATAKKLIDSCGATATDIQNCGKEVLDIAKNIAAETEALAELLRKHSTSIAAKVEDFTALTRRVGAAVEAARNNMNAPTLK